MRPVVDVYIPCSGIIYRFVESLMHMLPARMLNTY